MKWRCTLRSRKLRVGLSGVMFGSCRVVSILCSGTYLHQVTIFLPLRANTVTVIQLLILLSPRFKIHYSVLTLPLHAPYAPQLKRNKVVREPVYTTSLIFASGWTNCMIFQSKQFQIYSLVKEYEVDVRYCRRHYVILWVSYSRLNNWAYGE
jgi:hypothetical protein